MDCRVVERLLTPYLDGELDVASVVQVEEHLAGCASCAAEYRKLEELHREIAAAGLRYAPPAGLERRILAARRRPAREARSWWRQPSLMATAAAFAVLLLAIPVYRQVRDGSSGREVLENHLRSLQAAHLVDVPSSDQHTVKPWFQGKLTFAPNVLDLSANGFTLAGGRLDMIGRRQAAAIVYQRRQHVINLFVMAGDAGGSRPRFETVEGYNILRWTKGDLSYWAVSDLNAVELRRFAALSGMP